MFSNLRENLSAVWTLAAAFIVAFVFVFVFSQKLYSYIDQNEFQTPFQITDAQTKASETEKGIVLLDSITNQMYFELNSTFGWSANDLPISWSAPWILDNRAYRQHGVYIGTKILIDIYARYIAKLGTNDREDPNLFIARSSCFPLSSKKWGYISESAESAYRNGFTNLDIYKENLKKGKATYNCKTDDLHTALTTITSDQLLGYALGLLENFEDQPFYTVDNSIYEVQGIVLVIRDFLNATYKLYPQIASKNNEENFKQAMYYMDKICDFNPLWISNNPFNSGAVVRSYLLNVTNRIGDLANSLKI